jgi:predicted metal-dependent HD superfamily phosphohydrolase
MAIKNDGISTREARLCVLAAAFHDVVHNGDSAPDNEEQSADFAEALMKTNKEFTHQDIKHVRHMILATKCSQKYPKLIQTPLPHDYAAKLLCDADKASFGKPYEEFYESAMHYFHEIHGEQLTQTELGRFLGLEHTLLCNHSFWTKEADIAFPHTKDNCKQLLRTTQKTA